MGHPRSDQGHTSNASVKMPRLSSYYGSPTVQPLAFLREVRTAVKAARASKADPPSFDVRDAEETLERLAELDPTLVRTVKLLGKDPHQVRHWVARVTRDAFENSLADCSCDEDSTQGRFERFIVSSADDLLGTDKRRRERAQNLLRLSLPWLVELQNLKLEEALPLVGRAKRARTKSTDLRRAIGRLLFRVPVPQLMNISLVSAFFEEALADALDARQNALWELSRSRDEQAARIREISELRNEIERAVKKRNELAERMAVTEAQLKGQKELRAIDRVQIRGRARSFLIDRLAPLISDARDALEFDPPQIDGARQRLDMVISAIAKELDKPDE
ncbi:MAG: hypothetical protein F4X56_02220 [Gammaproteobacteria bacterium]|nr:hypothetical protein [Gammaproteobacteria bacterium]